MNRFVPANGQQCLVVMRVENRLLAMLAHNDDEATCPGQHISIPNWLSNISSNVSTVTCHHCEDVRFPCAVAA